MIASVSGKFAYYVQGLCLGIIESKTHFMKLSIPLHFIIGKKTGNRLIVINTLPTFIEPVCDTGDTNPRS